MNPSYSLYDSPRLAAGYAFYRPPVHPYLVRAMQKRLALQNRVKRALDIGCGAGLSTTALEPLAETVVGMDPVRTMLSHCQTVAPHAHFLVGQAERLPFSDEAFGLLAAAGSLNYVDLNLFFPEARRVLAQGGWLIIYDFSVGRHIKGSNLLETWYAAFECRYPPFPDYDLDVRGLAYSQAGLRLEDYEEMQVAISMNLETYLAYALSETGVEAAVMRGEAESEISEWCQSTLHQVFGGETREVLFDAYVAYVRSCM